MNPIEVWRRRGDYYIRGKITGDEKGVPQVPYACVHVDRFNDPNPNGERYWAAFGMTRDAPIWEDE